MDHQVATSMQDAIEAFRERTDAISTALANVLHAALRSLIEGYIVPSFALRHTQDLAIKFGKNLTGEIEYAVNCNKLPLYSMGDCIAFFSNLSLGLWDGSGDALYFANECNLFKMSNKVLQLRSDALVCHDYDHLTVWTSMPKRQMLRNRVFFLCGDAESANVSSVLLSGCGEPKGLVCQQNDKDHMIIDRVITAGGSNVAILLRDPGVVRPLTRKVLLFDTKLCRCVQEWNIDFLGLDDAGGLIMYSVNGGILVNRLFNGSKYLLKLDGTRVLSNIRVAEPAPPKVVRLGDDQAFLQKRFVLLPSSTSKVREECIYIAVGNTEIGMQRLSLAPPVVNGALENFAHIAALPGNRLVAINSQYSRLSLFE